MLDLVAFARAKQLRAAQDGIVAGEIVLRSDERQRVVRYRDDMMRWRDVPRAWMPFLPLMPWQMALAFVQRTNGGAAADTTSYVTASISPSAGALLFADISHTNNAAVASISTTLSMATAFTQLLTPLQFGGVPRISVWWGITGATPGTGTVTFNFSANENRLYTGWAIDEFTGQHASPLGTPGTGTGNPSSITLGAFADANSRFYAFAMDWGGTAGGQSFNVLTNLAKWSTDGGGVYNLSSGYNPTNNSNSASFTPGSGTSGAGMIGVEVKAAAAGGGGSFRNFYGAKFYGTQYAPRSPAERERSLTCYYRERAAAMRQFMARVERNDMRRAA